MDDRTVNAAPTKKFFIEILTKDVTLLQVIPDLVDNSVDGALRLRGTDDFRGLEVRITVREDVFEIADNCGGIPVNLARNYAFRFGRPDDAPNVEQSTGLFGVGLKRGIFKIGRYFRIESTTSHSRFVIEEDIDEWAKIPAWEFEFTELDEGLQDEVPQANQGTQITVTKLHQSVADDFRLESFTNRLRSTIEARHQRNLAKGLSIVLNGIPLGFQLSELLESGSLQPAYKLIEYPAGEKTNVTVQLYAGIAESSPQHSGWYIFCNGRQVVAADKTTVTGWGDGVAGYHPQYARFRGYVFFESRDPAFLPWNTTKDGVDEDSELYRTVRLEMKTLMKPVLTFLNDLKNERSERDDEEEQPGEADSGPLGKAIAQARPVQVLDLNIPPQSFSVPTQNSTDLGPQTVTIRYKKPLEQVERVKRTLMQQGSSVSDITNKQVGEQTFEYYLLMECDE